MMNQRERTSEDGGILMVSILTIAVLAMICAIALNVTSQNANSTTQTTSWQQSLAGAEAGADLAMDALNTKNWSGWYTVNGTLSWNKPSGGTAATAAPGSGQYNYFIPPSLNLQGEASNAVSMWVALDPVPEQNNGTVSASKQPYRIRAAGTVAVPGPARVSNQKTDNALRKISLRTDRTTGSAVTTPEATRRLELIAMPVTTNLWGRGITMGNWISMVGGGTIDSFNSGDPRYSRNGLYDPSRRLSNAPIAMLNSTGSNLGNTYVYGNIQYSGPAIQNTSNVQGTISTPFNATLPTTVDPIYSYWWDATHNGVQSQPTFAAGNFTTYSGRGSLPSTIEVTGGANSPTFIRIDGDLRVGGSDVLSLTTQVGSIGERYLTVWVTGDFIVTSSVGIQQDPNVHVVWVVDGDITCSGDSYNNQSGRAGNVAMIGVGGGEVNVSGNSSFIGTVNAPGYDITISGIGGFCGAVIGNTLTMVGGAGLHYDEALATGGANSVANYTYASWFEDNSAPGRGITY